MSIDTLVFLEHADDRIAYFRKCELLADTDARAAVEGDVLFWVLEMQDQFGAVNWIFNWRYWVGIDGVRQRGLVGRWGSSR